MENHFSSETDWQKGVVLLIDKPLGWTSFNIVSKIRSLLYHNLGLKKIKVGHAGTLDPLATGLLVVCVGKATKRVVEFQHQDKEYLATFALGATTPSFDLETSIDHRYPIEHVSLELIEEALVGLSGEQMQIPPLFSAKSVDGGRAYKLARRGVVHELDPVPVTIHKMEVVRFALPTLELRVRCSKGTYIRSLARDIGKAVNSGAHLTELRRISSGSFNVSNAMSIDYFENKIRTM